MQGLVNIEKPIYHIYLTKIKTQSSLQACEIREKTLNSRNLYVTEGSWWSSLLIWIQKKTYIIYSYQINCWSSRNDQINTLINLALLSMYCRWTMSSYWCSVSFVKYYTEFRSRDAMIAGVKWKFFCKYQITNAAEE